MAATVNVAVARPSGGDLAGSGWVSSVAGLLLALGGPPLYYQVLFPRIAETWPDSLISGAIGFGFMWLLAVCAVVVVLVWQRQPPGGARSAAAVVALGRLRHWLRAGV